MRNELLAELGYSKDELSAKLWVSFMWQQKQAYNEANRDKL